MTRRLAMLCLAAISAGCGRLSYDSRDGAPADSETLPDGWTLPEPVCGDGYVSGDEACDDANAQTGDGCESDCSFSCASSGACADAIICNGDETCNPDTHACEGGATLADGTPCGPAEVCRAGTCALATCGNMTVDAGEDCDDGDIVAGDGCESDCTFTCSIADDCSDSETCNGIESCDSDAHMCGPGAATLDGSDCDRDAMPATLDICVSGACVRARCGDRYVDPDTELCDDGNAINGDGCDDDCTPTCTNDEECADGQRCNGIETCAASTCHPGTQAPDGTLCPGGTCSGGACLLDGGVPGIDGGLVTSIDGGTSGGCERRGDCERSEQCCATCPTFPGICWPMMIVCPFVLCEPGTS